MTRAGWEKTNGLTRGLQKTVKIFFLLTAAFFKPLGGTTGQGYF